MKTKTNKTRATPLGGASNTITSLPESPVHERHGRMVRYSISMGIRMACFITVFFVPDWWRVLPAIGAIVLPYIAVVLANAGHDGPAGEVERPGAVEVYRPDERGSGAVRGRRLRSARAPAAAPMRRGWSIGGTRRSMPPIG